MENASKALLIAAAILIVIILVAVGVKVLNSTSGSKDSASAIGESMSVAAYNSRIKSYAGPNKSTKEVCEVLKIAKSHNEKTNRKIGISVVNDLNRDKMVKTDQTSTSSAIDARIRGFMSPTLEKIPYNLYLYYDADGYIEVIGIEHGINYKYKADYNSQIVGE